MGIHQIPLFRKVAIATKNAIERAFRVRLAGATARRGRDGRRSPPRAGYSRSQPKAALGRVSRVKAGPYGFTQLYQR
jgi:hypothetical protein